MTSALAGPRDLALRRCMATGIQVSLRLRSSEGPPLPWDLRLSCHFRPPGALELLDRRVYILHPDEVARLLVLSLLLVHAPTDALPPGACGNQPVVESRHGGFLELPTKNLRIELA